MFLRRWTLWHRNPKEIWNNENCLQKFNQNIEIQQIFVTTQRVQKHYIIPILLFRCEWFLFFSKKKNRLGSLEIRLPRRILRIPWNDHLINKEVLMGIRKKFTCTYNQKETVEISEMWENVFLLNHFKEDDNTSWELGGYREWKRRRRL